MRSSRQKLGNRGAVAVEFALIGVGFFGLIATIIAVSSYFYVQSAIDAAASAAARTMQIKTSRLTAQTLGDFDAVALCPAIGQLLKCSAVKTVIVLPVPVNTDYRTFMTDAANHIPPGNVPPVNPPAFNSGEDGDQMLMLLYYQLDLGGIPMPVGYVVGTAAYENEQ